MGGRGVWTGPGAVRGPKVCAATLLYFDLWYFCVNLKIKPWILSAEIQIFKNSVHGHCQSVKFFWLAGTYTAEILWLSIAGQCWLLKSWRSASALHKALLYLTRLLALQGPWGSKPSFSKPGNEQQGAREGKLTSAHLDSCPEISMYPLTHLLAVKLSISYQHLLTVSLLQRRRWMNHTAPFQGQRRSLLATIPIRNREMGSAQPCRSLCLAQATLCPHPTSRGRSWPWMQTVLGHISCSRTVLFSPGSSTAEPSFQERCRRTQGSPDLKLRNSVMTALL